MSGPPDWTRRIMERIMSGDTTGLRIDMPREHRASQHAEQVIAEYDGLLLDLIEGRRKFHPGAIETTAVEVRPGSSSDPPC